MRRKFLSVLLIMMVTVVGVPNYAFAESANDSETDISSIEVSDTSDELVAEPSDGTSESGYVEEIKGTYRPVKITLDKNHPSYSFSYDSDCLKRSNHSYTKPTSSYYYATIYVRTSQETTADVDSEELLFVQDSQYAGKYRKNISAFWSNERSTFDEYGAYEWVRGYGYFYRAGSTITVYVDEELIGDDKVVVVAGLQPYCFDDTIFMDKDGNYIEGSYADNSSHWGIDNIPEDPEGYIDGNGTAWAFEGWYDQYGIKLNTNAPNGYDSLVFHPEYTEGYKVSFVDGEESEIGSIIVAKGAELKTLDSKVLKISAPQKDNAVFDKWVDSEGRELGSFNISENTTFHATYKKTGEQVTFHKVTSIDEYVKGAHYIFTYAGSDSSANRIALSCDEDNNFVKAVAIDTESNKITLPIDHETVFTATSADSNDTVASCKFKASNGQLMKLGTDSSDPTPMFNEKGGTISVSSQWNGSWYVNNSGRALWYNTWNQYFHAGKYSQKGDSSYVEVWTDYAGSPSRDDQSSEEGATDAVSYNKISTLAELDSAKKFVVVAVTTDENGSVVRKALTSSYPYLTDVVIDDGKTIEISSTKNGSLKGSAELKHGDSEGSGKSYRKYSSIKTITGSYYNPGRYLTSGSLFYKIEGVRVEQKNGKFYLRGNKNERWLGYDSVNKKVAIVNESSENRVEIEIYATESGGDYSVTFNGISGDNVIYTDDSFIVKDAPATDVTAENGAEYTFVGWSTEKPTGRSESSARYLTLDESSNIYQYNDELGFGSVTDEAKEKYGLIGTCNPDKDEVLDIKDYTLDENDNLNLYPVYAVKGYSTAASSDDSDGNAIVAISDWKMQEAEGEGKYDNDEKEKWLGYIELEVYLDGEKYGSTEKMYFRYHNDNSADINIKFVDSESVKNKYNGSLYDFTSDQGNYPETSQIGNYRIDGVYAVQGASEDGLTCKYNWMTSNGGQLDNVKGGTTVKVYLTSLYQVEYFYDSNGDGTYDKLTGDEWQNGNYYSTPGTEKAFGDENAETGISATAEYQVTADNENCDLMNKIDAYDNWFFEGKMSKKDAENSLNNSSDNVRSAGSGRTTYAGFAYHITDWNHTIPVAALPEAEKGYELTSDSWALNNEDGEAYENVKPSSDFEVQGGAYSSVAVEGSNTHETFVDDDDSTHTYHLYISAMKSASRIDPPGGDSDTGVDTSDSSNITLWCSMMALSLMAMLLLVVVRSMKRRKCRR